MPLSPLHRQAVLIGTFHQVRVSSGDSVSSPNYRRKAISARLYKNQRGGVRPPEVEDSMTGGTKGILPSRRIPGYAKALIAVVGVLLAIVVAGVVWAETPLGPTDEAMRALETGGGVTVEHTSSGWEFRSDGTTTDTGVIIYPGGRVDARSYSPLARALAERGYFVVITPVTLNLAVMSPNVGDRAREAHPDVTRWGIVGHSLGGAMAATHVANRPGAYSALVFLAAYPPDGTDLTEAVPTVVSVYGDRDGGLKMEKIVSTRPLLPEDTTFTEVAGANHAQWGAYGPQPGDLSATISAAEQLAFAVDAVVMALGDAD